MTLNNSNHNVRLQAHYFLDQQIYFKGSENNKPGFFMETWLSLTISIIFNVGQYGYAQTSRHT